MEEEEIVVVSQGAYCQKREGNTITIGQCYEKDVPVIGCACLCGIEGGSGCDK